MWKILVMCLFLVGCATTQYVPVEVTNTEYINKEIRDSIYIRDSVFVKSKNDTVFLEKYTLVYKDKVIRDTVFKTDSIPTIKTVEIVKEVNIIKNWQIILMVLGGVFIAYVIIRIKNALFP